jgi:hypothetical protein
MFDECCASGASCIYDPNGPKGESQCRYCGKPEPTPVGMTDYQYGFQAGKASGGLARWAREEYVRGWRAGNKWRIAQQESASVGIGPSKSWANEFDAQPKPYVRLECRDFDAPITYVNVYLSFSGRHDYFGWKWNSRKEVERQSKGAAYRLIIREKK